MDKKKIICQNIKAEIDTNGEELLKTFEDTPYLFLKAIHDPSTDEEMELHERIVDFATMIIVLMSVRKQA